MTDDLSRAEIEAMVIALERVNYSSSGLKFSELLREMATAAHAAASRVREERGYRLVGKVDKPINWCGAQFFGSEGNG